MLHNRSVKTLLQIGVWCLVTFIVLVLGVFAFKFSSIHQAIKVNTAERVIMQQDALVLVRAAHDRAAVIRDVVSYAYELQQQKTLQMLEQLILYYTQSADQFVKLAQRSDHSTELQALHETVQAIDNMAIASLQRVVTRVQFDDTVGAFWLLITDFTPLYADWLGAMNQLIDHQEARVEELGTAVMREVTGFVVALLVLLGLAIVIGIQIGRLVIQNFLRHLDTETSVLAQLDAAQQQFTDLVEDVQRSLDAFNTCSFEATLCNEAQSHLNTQQSMNLMETAASLSHAYSVQHFNAQTTSEALALASALREATVKSAEVLEKAELSVHGLAEGCTMLTEHVKELEKVHHQINCLAINATVGAAQLNQQGDGIAKGTTEIRRLTQHSSGVIKTINGLIDTHVVTHVLAGQQQSKAVKAVMADMTQQIRRLLDHIKEISANIQEQNVDVTQITSAVSKLDTAIHQSNDLLERNMATTSMLSRQTEKLLKIVVACSYGTHPANDTQEQPFHTPKRNGPVKHTHVLWS